ncbi:MAG TPA: hypothetical protein VGH43_11740 [Jatrophihabitans sp.]|jgi:hypothetical protein
MTEQNPPAEPSPSGEWAVPEQPAEPSDAPPPVAPRRNWRRPLGAAALVTGGVVLGAGAAVLISSAGGDGDGHGVAAAGARAGYPGAPGVAGVAGEQQVQGTVSAVGTSSITVSTSSGKSTYSVSSSTQIIRNGSAATLDQINVGDPVVVHLIPSSSGQQVERIIAGTMTEPGGAGGPNDDREGGHH